MIQELSCSHTVIVSTVNCTNISGRFYGTDQGCEWGRYHRLVGWWRFTIPGVTDTVEILTFSSGLNKKF